jgi:hypothetical protein
MKGQHAFPDIQNDDAYEGLVSNVREQRCGMHRVRARERLKPVPASEDRAVLPDSTSDFPPFQGCRQAQASEVCSALTGAGVGCGET